jgi:hypothetical protein
MHEQSGKIGLHFFTELSHLTKYGLVGQHFGRIFFSRKPLVTLTKDFFFGQAVGTIWSKKTFPAQQQQKLRARIRRGLGGQCYDRPFSAIFTNYQEKNKSRHLLCG